jgi:hypothetical protein
MRRNLWTDTSAGVSDLLGGGLDKLDHRRGARPPTWVLTIGGVVSTNSIADVGLDRRRGS